MIFNQPERPPFDLERALRLHSIVFIVLSVAVTFGAVLLPRFNEQAELFVLTALIVILGVPHGALDTLFAQRLYRISTVRGWLMFGAIYCIAASLIVGVWFFAPLVFLCGFLIISAAHFSGDPVAGALGPTRIVHGGVIVVLPALYYAQDIGRLLGFLAGPEAAEPLSAQLAFLAPLWLFALAACVILEARNSMLRAAELLALGLLATFAPPLIAFTVFFCGMHSARHILRTLDYARVRKPRSVALAGLIPMAGIFAALTVGWLLMSDISLDESVIQVVFVGLAALTVPHMALVERVRFSGWSRNI